jgi:hypothetical protein
MTDERAGFVSERQTHSRILRFLSERGMDGVEFQERLVQETEVRVAKTQKELEKQAVMQALKKN